MIVYIEINTISVWPNKSLTGLSMISYVIIHIYFLGTFSTRDRLSSSSLVLAVVVMAAATAACGAAAAERPDAAAGKSTLRQYIWWWE